MFKQTKERKVECSIIIAFLTGLNGLKFGNIEYQVDAVIVIGFCGVLPLFGIIKELFLICNKPFIKVSMCKTVSLDC